MQDRSGVRFTSAFQDKRKTCTLKADLSEALKDMCMSQKTKSDDIRSLAEQLLRAWQPARPLALDLTEIEDRKQKGQLLC